MKQRLLITLVASALYSSAALSFYSSKWDTDFQDAVMLHMPHVDWRILKSQCIAESDLRPNAISPVGAMGLCQFMPGTWRDMQERDASLVDPLDPVLSIHAAARYMADLNRFWRSPRPHKDRYCLAIASYNAGAGHLVKAQRLASDKVHCEPIMSELHRVTGHHSKETCGYVKRIFRIYPQLLLD